MQFIRRIRERKENHDKNIQIYQEYYGWHWIISVNGTLNWLNKKVHRSFILELKTKIWFVPCTGGKSAQKRTQMVENPIFFGATTKRPGAAGRTNEKMCAKWVAYNYWPSFIWGVEITCNTRVVSTCCFSPPFLGSFLNKWMTGGRSNKVFEQTTKLCILLRRKLFSSCS